MPQYSFSFLSYPGATSTSGLGINDAGEVVGSYVIPNSPVSATLGFSEQNGVFTSYDYVDNQMPPFPSTAITGVAASGVLAGERTSAVNQYEVGFTSSNDTYTQLPQPSGASYTQYSGIDPAGTIVVGAYQYGRYYLGFTYSAARGFTTINYPGYGISNIVASNNSVTGINVAGDLVGTYGRGSETNGFLDVGGVFTTIDPPGSTSITPTGINAADEVVGNYVDANGAQNAFLDVGGTFSEIVVPGATVTSVSGINDAGEIVGAATINGVTTAFTAVPTVCFAAGTMIRVVWGEVAVEELAVGDFVVTAPNEHRPICWIGHRTLSDRENGRALPHDQQPIRIRAGAFGAGLPQRDLLLSPGHPVLVGADAAGESGVLVPIMCLVNGTTVERVPVESVTYWHVELDAHDILLAEGLPAESYLDWGDRAFFEDASAHALANPDFVVPGLAGRCRPVAVDGPVVEQERRRLDAVFAATLAAQCGWSEVAAYG